MMIFRKLCFVLLALSATPALAQEAGGEELVEKVVVRNRLFNVKGRFEVGLNAGFSMISRLTDTYNFTISPAYNFLDSLALELRVGYAYSAHSGLADDLAIKFFRVAGPAATSTAVPIADDLQDMWELKFNAMVGLRWQPIYGKLGLMAEVPVHFQFYLWIGGGVAMLDRTSVVICNQEGMVTDPATGRPIPGCTRFLSKSKVGPLLSAAGGFRFFLTDRVIVRFEVRDLSWFDSYVTGARRTLALSANTPEGGGTEITPGLTNVVQFDLGAAFIF